MVDANLYIQFVCLFGFLLDIKEHIPNMITSADALFDLFYFLL